MLKKVRGAVWELINSCYFRELTAVGPFFNWHELLWYASLMRDLRKIQMSILYWTTAVGILTLGLPSNFSVHYQCMYDVHFTKPSITEIRKENLVSLSKSVRWNFYVKVIWDRLCWLLSRNYSFAQHDPVRFSRKGLLRDSNDHGRSSMHVKSLL